MINDAHASEDFYRMLIRQYDRTIIIVFVYPSYLVVL
jgi:hypothetical protein